jgi:hyperosmotically inducible protein
MIMSALRLLILAGLMGAAPALAQQSAGERIDDAETTAKVKAALIDDETAKARDIDVETQSGVVQLSGFVESEAVKSAAEETARSVEGVEEVRSALIVRATERTPGAVVDDSVIAAKVKSGLATDAGLDTASAVNVEVRSGVVQLSGFVESEEEKSRAESVASAVEGVAEIRNDIDVQR